LEVKKQWLSSAEPMKNGLALSVRVKGPDERYSRAAGGGDETRILRPEEKKKSSLKMRVLYLYSPGKPCRTSV